MGFLALDGVDGVYANFLDLLFTELRAPLRRRALWWTTFGEITERLFSRLA